MIALWRAKDEKALKQSGAKQNPQEEKAGAQQAGLPEQNEARLSVG